MMRNMGRKKDERTTSARMELEKQYAQIVRIRRENKSLMDFINLNIPVLVKKNAINRVYDYVTQSRSAFLLGHETNTKDIFEGRVTLMWNRISSIIEKIEFININEITDTKKVTMPKPVIDQIKNHDNTAYIAIYKDDTSSLAIFFEHKLLKNGSRKKSTDNRIGKIFTFTENGIMYNFPLTGKLFPGIDTRIEIYSDDKTDPNPFEKFEDS